MQCFFAQAKSLDHQPDRPRLLVCHDLHGNYHSDALPQGDQDSDYYRLTQWSSIDTFVYFSHALVTIPPPGWTNAAHSNAVPVRHLQVLPQSQILATCLTQEPRSCARMGYICSNDCHL